jgi:uncharacterized protein YlaI
VKKPKHCKHGNNVTLYLCPECDHEKNYKRQRRADRARFAAQIARITGKQPEGDG